MDIVERVGPCWLLANGVALRRNAPSACDLCRKRRVRCLVTVEGASCPLCRKHGVACVVAGTRYSPDGTPAMIYKSVLPPPPVPPTSPMLAPVKTNNPGPAEFSALVAARHRSSGSAAPLAIVR